MNEGLYFEVWRPSAETNKVEVSSYGNFRDAITKEPLTREEVNRIISEEEVEE